MPRLFATRRGCQHNKGLASLARDFVGLNVIGSRSTNNDLNAMLAAWVMQIAFEPRMVAVSLENDAFTLRYIRATSV